MKNNSSFSQETIYWCSVIFRPKRAFFSIWHLWRTHYYFFVKLTFQKQTYFLHFQRKSSITSICNSPNLTIKSLKRTRAPLADTNSLSVALLTESVLDMRLWGGALYMSSLAFWRNNFWNLPLFELITDDQCSRI